MRIARVHIEHFRSIKELDFEPGPYCVLIGENNSGKSNILRALNLILGERWPSERSFSEEDFHNQDTSKPIVIQVFFDGVIRENRHGVDIDIGGIELRCKAYKRRVGKKPAGSISTDYFCLRPDGKQATAPSAPLRKGTKAAFLPMRVTSAIREQAAPMIYVGEFRGHNTKLLTICVNHNIIYLWHV